MNRDALRADLIRDEGMRLSAYKDSEGYWTIGVGHLLGRSPRMSAITEEECNALLDVDIAEAENLARSVVPRFDDLSEPRQLALVNMAFNRGGHLRSSQWIVPAIRKASESNSPEDWTAVREAIKVSQWAKQVGSRATRLGDVFAGGA